MSEQINNPDNAPPLPPGLQEKLGKALYGVLGKDDKLEPGERSFTQEEYELRIEYARLSWRLLSQIGPYQFREQAGILLQSMALSKVLGDEEDGFINKVIEAYASSGMAPVATEKP